MITKFRKKPVVIEAMCYDGSADCNRAIIDWTRGSKTPATMDKGPFDDDRQTLTIATLEGSHWVSNGDYVIKGVAGEFYPVKPGIFNATYELVG